MSILDSMDSDRPVMVAIPFGVNLSAKSTTADREAVFLARLSLYTSMSPERQRDRHWIPIPAKLPRMLLGTTEYRKRIERLCGAGIIEVNDSYSDGKIGGEAFPKAYRFTKAHCSGRHRLHQLKSKRAREIALKEKQIDPANLRPAGMYYWQHGNSFQLDRSAVDAIGHEDYWTQWNLGQWKSGENYATRCDYGRYHSLLTRTPRTVRPFLTTAAGERLGIVDVSAAQPSLIGAVAANMASSHGAPPKWNQRGRDAPGYLCNVADFFGGYEEKRRVIQNAPTDIQQWIELCESGLIYDYMLDQISRLPGPAMIEMRNAQGTRFRVDARDMNRSQIKRATLVPLFDHQDATERNPLFQIVRRDFPTIARSVELIKSQTVPDGRKLHEALARLLQLLESTLMIDGVGTVLERQHKDEPVQPIHDAILCRMDFCGQATEIIKAQFARLGLRPLVKLDACN
ncbi:hypothetical protein [Stieleria varia]|uniref:Uncharacterized protein n=1 Tax=Stieleria varia TaxID=2528005 RepID=A0A5C6BAT7_9BACT|nr:hypothetical protein [Stieleria varia]TWU08389.1 hypothetical protein Pla52n_09710 [Stieleria varia]